LFSKQKKIESRERRRDSERKFDEREREREREEETSVVEMFRGEKKDGKEWKGRKLLVIKLVIFFL
jgi:hypothetical protein